MFIGEHFSDRECVDYVLQIGAISAVVNVEPPLRSANFHSVKLSPFEVTETMAELCREQAYTKCIQSSRCVLLISALCPVCPYIPDPTHFSPDYASVKKYVTLAPLR